MASELRRVICKWFGHREWVPTSEWINGIPAPGDTEFSRMMTIFLVDMSARWCRFLECPRCGFGIVEWSQRNPKKSWRRRMLHGE